MQLKPLLMRLALSGVAILVVLTAVECVFWFRLGFPWTEVPENVRIHDLYYQDRDQCWRMPSNARGWHISYEGQGERLVEVNSIGTVGAEPRDDGSRRIAFLGDSIVFNGGIPPSNAFPVLVEQHLNAVGGMTGRRWQSLNFGMSDLGIEDYERKLKYHALEHKPDIVVVGLYLNDSRPPQGFLGESRRSGIGQAIRRSGLDRLHLVRYVHKRVGRWRIKRNPAINQRFGWVRAYQDKSYASSEEDWLAMLEKARYDWGAAWREESWVLIEEKLAGMRQLCLANGASIVVVLFPVSVQMELADRFSSATFPQRRAAEVCGRLNIPLLDLLPVYLENKDKAILADQCHLTSVGNRIVSVAIAGFITNNEKQVTHE